MDFKTAKKVFWGTSEAKKVYYGSRLVWENIPPVTLPNWVSVKSLYFMLMSAALSNSPLGRYIWSFDYLNDTGSDMLFTINIGGSSFYVAIEKITANGQTLADGYDIKMSPGLNKYTVTFQYKYNYGSDGKDYITAMQDSKFWKPENFSNVKIAPA